MYKCQECGKKYKTTASAEKAQMNGCKCGGTDIDLDTDSSKPATGRDARILAIIAKLEAKRVSKTATV